jgi:hypothetical protein
MPAETLPPIRFFGRILERELGAEVKTVGPISRRESSKRRECRDAKSGCPHIGAATDAVRASETSHLGRKIAERFHPDGVTIKGRE